MSYIGAILAVQQTFPQSNFGTFWPDIHAELVGM
jgi:hypothetical protein